MQISPIPSLDDETNQIRLMTAQIVGEEIIPNEHFLRRRDARAGQEWTRLIKMVQETCQ